MSFWNCLTKAFSNIFSKKMVPICRKCHFESSRDCLVWGCKLQNEVVKLIPIQGWLTKGFGIFTAMQRRRMQIEKYCQGLRYGCKIGTKTRLLLSQNNFGPQLFLYFYTITKIFRIFNPWDSWRVLQLTPNLQKVLYKPKFAKNFWLVYKNVRPTCLLWFLPGPVLFVKSGAILKRPPYFRMQ